MRLLEVFQKPDYQPLDRGEAFPQFHEDGDRFRVFNNMMWAYHWWIHATWEAPMGHNTFDPAWLMGGEL